MNQMTKSADGSSGLLRRITKPTAWRGGEQILKEQKDVRLMDRCEKKRQQWARNWQCKYCAKSRTTPWKCRVATGGRPGRAKRKRSGEDVEVWKTKQEWEVTTSIQKCFCS